MPELQTFEIENNIKIGRKWMWLRWLRLLTRQSVKHYSINVTGVPSGLGVDLEEPFIFTAPGEDSGEGVDETEEEQAEDEESTSDESLFE